MVLHLQGRRVVRAVELAGHFEVNIRTVYRDIAALGEAGVPISGEAGVGYCLMKGYQLPPVMFTAEEATSLFVGGELVKRFTDASLHTPMVSALDKLRAVLPKERQDHIEKLTQRTLVYGRPDQIVPEAAAQRWLITVQQGVVLRRVLRMDYRGRGQEVNTPREVEPLGIVFYGGAWYLVAWCRLRQDYRHFRVDRIRGLELSSVVFAAREDFSLVKHMKEATTREDVLPVKVWFANRAQDRARRESQATLVKGEVRESGAEFALYAWSLEWLARWLLSFGADAEALAPAKLRKLVKQEARAVLEKYQD